MNTLPTLFLSHGAPNVTLYDTPARRFYDGLAAQLPRPRAILVASAHYEAGRPSLTVAASPRTIHDFSGFEPELFAVRYPAPGSPELARRAAALIEDALGAPAALDERWGFDHGTWSPLARIYPAADIPVVALSIDCGADPAAHLELGRALRALRHEGVLVCGSGSITHNLSRIVPPMDNTDAPAWILEFRDWMERGLLAGDDASLVRYRAAAPHAALNHPTDEHLLPLFVAMGAAGEAWRASKLHASVTFGTLAMDAYRFD